VVVMTAGDNSCCKSILLSADLWISMNLTEVFRTFKLCFVSRTADARIMQDYSGRKVTASFGNVTVRGGKRWKGQGGSTMANSLSVYSVTENIYYSKLSSVAILLQPEPNCFTSYNTRRRLGFLFVCAIVLRSFPPSHVSTSNGQRSLQLFCVHYTG
jgi:hypothetical protein